MFAFGGRALLAAAVVCGVASVPAMSADLGAPSLKDGPTYYSPVARWTGGYIGAHIGSAKSDFDLEFPTTPDQSGRGIAGGLQIGYNYQFPTGIVIGIEADVSFADISDSVMDGNYIVQSSKVDAFGTVRGRLGYAIDGFLPYITGGLAWQSGETGEYCPPGAPFGHCSRVGAYDNKTSLESIGWAYGFGVEYQFSRHISLKAEYLRLDFGKERYDVGAPASVRTISQDIDVIRAGVNYKF